MCEFSALAFRPACVAATSDAKVWNARTGALRATLTGHTDNVMTATFSPDARLIATASVDNTARIWDASSGAQLRLLQGPGYTARFRPDAGELVTTGRGDYAVIWNITLDRRSPAQIAALVQQRSPWQLRSGKLVLRTDLDGPQSSPTRSSSFRPTD